MAIFTGTPSDDVMKPGELSPGVTAQPPGAVLSAAADMVNGLDGNDDIDGGGGFDTISGGAGDDSIEAAASGSKVHGDAGADVITIRHETDRVAGAVYGDAGDDSITFSSWPGEPTRPSGTLKLHGGAGADVIVSEGTDPSDYSKLNIKTYGGNGDDRLEALRLFTFSNVYSYAEGGNDTLYGGRGNDTFVVYGEEDAVVEAADEGVDTVEAVMTPFTLPANVENLVVIPQGAGLENGRYGGNALNNVMTGSYVSDVVHGGEGNDTLYGYSGTGDDRDADTLYGDLGNDTIYGQSGNDRIYGGRSDNDRADGDDTIYAGDGNDDVWAGGGNDTVEGGAGNDNLYGQSGNDTLRGGDGDERVYGGTGNDTLYGDGGVDNVRGGEGLDRLSGGGGNDRFDYDAVGESRPGASTRDVILDFEGAGGAAGDRIDLATIDANAGRSGNQTFSFVGTAAFTGAGQVRVTGSGEDTLVQANTGGSLSPELEIAVQDAGVQPEQWLASDFIL